MASKLEKMVLDAMVEAAPLNLAKAEALAERFGIKTRSIIASATRNGIPYEKKARVNKAGLPVVDKADLVERIAEKIGVKPEELDGLEKASKTALMLLDTKLDYPAIEEEIKEEEESDA